MPTLEELLDEALSDFDSNANSLYYELGLGTDSIPLATPGFAGIFGGAFIGLVSEGIKRLLGTSGLSFSGENFFLKDLQGVLDTLNMFKIKFEGRHFF